MVYRTAGIYPDLQANGIKSTTVPVSTRSSNQTPSLPWSPPRTGRRPDKAETELHLKPVVGPPTPKINFSIPGTPIRTGPERKSLSIPANSWVPLTPSSPTPSPKLERKDPKQLATPRRVSTTSSAGLPIRRKSEFQPSQQTQTPPRSPYNFLHSTTEHTPSSSLPKIPALRDGVTLFSHQVRGVAWMFDREQPSQGKFGGLNADVMGMGKTLQAIALVAYPRKDAVGLKRGCTAPTLVVCPANLIPQWVDMITLFSTLSPCAFHGSQRISMQIDKYDIVVTSYHTLIREHEIFNEAKSQSLKRVHPLYSRKWLRVILDESQLIKNPKSKSCHACLEVSSLFRWCLTGTPIQNSVTDFFPLFQFLKISPLSDVAYFEHHITKPLKNNPGNQQAIQLLHDSLLPIMIRRPKGILSLPQRTVEIVRCPFGPDELAFYNALSERMTELIEVLIRKAESQDRQFYTTVLVMLLRLRQACVHSELILQSHLDGKAEKEEDGEEGIHCGICQTNLENTSGHCQKCSDSILGRIRKLQGRPSTKLKTLIRILSDISKQSNGKDKTAVYSQWTTMLDIGSLSLTEKGIKHVHYRGGMSVEQRQRSLDAIADDSTVSVILVSLKAGGTGLNLTACNHLVLLDPWWNPAVEEQAFDRIHRIRQTKPVFIYKLIIQDPTVEDRILEIQEIKRQLSDNILSASENERRGDGLSIQQLLTFFPDLSRTAVKKVANRK